MAHEKPAEEITTKNGNAKPKTTNSTSDRGRRMARTHARMLLRRWFSRTPRASAIDDVVSMSSSRAARRGSRRGGCARC